MSALLKTLVFRESALCDPVIADLPQPCGEVLRHLGLSRLRPIQRRALEGGLYNPERSENCVVAAPPGAEKKVVAILAAAAVLAHGGRVAWLAGEKRGAQRRLSLLKTGLGHLASDIGAPGESENASRLCSDVLVLTYEQALAGMQRGGDWLAGIGLIIVDNLTLLKDARRGSRVALALHLLKESPYAAPLLGLSAAPVAANLMRAWNGELVEAWNEPSDSECCVREGILDANCGRIRWRERWNSQGPAQEGFENLFGGDEWETALRVAREAAAAAGIENEAQRALLELNFGCALALANGREQVVLIPPSRRLARIWGMALAEARDGTNAYEGSCARASHAIDELETLEPCADHALLIRMLRAGIGTLHADLSPAACRIVERAAPPILIATPGMHVQSAQAPRTLLLWPWEFAQNGSGALQWAALSRDSYFAALRAFGSSERSGPMQILLPASGQAQAERFWRNYVTAEEPPLEWPQITGQQWQNATLTLLAQGARTLENLAASLSRLHGATAPGQKISGALGACETAGLLKKKIALGYLGLSDFGRIAALYGLEPQLVSNLRRALKAGDGVPFAPDAQQPLPAIWLLALQLSPREWPCGISHLARETRYLAAWSAALEEETTWPECVSEILTRRSGPTAPERAALEIGWRVALWASNTETPELEERTGWHAGLLARAAERLAWLARAAAEIVNLQGISVGGTQAWRRLAARLKHGVSDAVAGLERLNCPELGRMARNRLAEDGFDTPAAIAAADPEILMARLNSKAAAEQIWRTARRLAGGGNIYALANSLRFDRGKKAGISELEKDASDGSDITDRSNQIKLEINLASPGIVQVAGREVALAPKPFDLLVQLALAPGEVCTRDFLYQKLWPEDGPEDQQLDAHRRALTKALAALASARKNKSAQIIQVVRGHGFRLNLPAKAVHVKR